MNRLKTRGGEAAKRRKKKAPRRTSSNASSSSSGLTSPSSTNARTHAHTRPSLDVPSVGKTSPRSSGSSSSPTTPSAKECEQCGNAMLLDATAGAVSKSGKKAFSSGCQVCDYVVFRKAQRPCEHCGRSQCEYFCDWCGHGFHAKCARQRHEDVTSTNGFCCRKCEAEQVEKEDDEEEEGEDNEAEENPSSRCGECRRPFSSGAVVSKDKDAEEGDDTGFQVNQAVLVENDDVLYNAVITDVDARKERIKIHFLRWSKSFDDWYAMDDERINESLACDCCNRWFHIGCLPPIKSSGRFKDTTYVCPTCLEDAKAFYTGSRTAAMKASLALAAHHRGGRSNSAGSGGSSDDATSGSKKRNAKMMAGEEDDVKKEKANGGVKKCEMSRKLKRKRSGSVESVASVSAASDKSPRSPEKSGKMAEEAKVEAARTEASSADNAISKKRSRSESNVEEKTKASEKPAHSSPERVSTSEASAEKSAVASLTTAVAADTTPSVVAVAASASPEKPAIDAEDRPVKRRISGPSMSSLLNSASPQLDAAPTQRLVPPQPLAWTAKPKPIAQPRVADATIKTEAQRAKRAYVRTKPTRRTKERAQSGLSAFDILREVAEQSMSNELRAEITTPARAVAPPRTFPASTTWRAPALPFSSAPLVPAGLHPPSLPSTAMTSTPNSLSISSPSLAMSSSPRTPSMQSFVDVHFGIRREMYLRICQLEEERHLSADAAHRLRTLIYPTSDKFHDLKFVYVVNKELPSAQLTRRLLELLPSTGNATTTSSSSSSGTTTSSSSSTRLTLPLSLGVPMSTSCALTSTPATSRLSMPTTCVSSASEARPSTTALVPLTFPPPNFTSSLAPPPTLASKLRSGNGCCISSTCN